MLRAWSWSSSILHNTDLFWKRHLVGLESLALVFPNYAFSVGLQRKGLLPHRLQLKEVLFSKASSPKLLFRLRDMFLLVLHRHRSSVMKRVAAIST